MTAVSTPEFAVEGHYYAGGLRHRLFSPDSRPIWAPPADSVGFRDEFELAPDDCVVEMRRVQFYHSVVLWIGFFHTSVDASFGDRRNHAGIGVWIRNGAVVFPGKLAWALAQLGRQLARTQDPDGVASHIQRFTEAGFLPSYLRSSTEFPTTLSGIPASGLSPSESELYALEPVGSDEYPWTRLTNLLFNLLFSPTPLTSKSRILILLPGSQKVRSLQPRVISLGEDIDDPSLFMSTIPEAWLEAETQLQVLQQRTAGLEARLLETEELHQDKLRVISHQETELQSLRKRVAEFEADPHFAIQASISHFGIALESMREEMRDLRRIRSDVQSMVQWLREGNGNQSATRSDPVKQLAPRLRSHAWLTAACIVALVLLAVIGWQSMKTAPKWLSPELGNESRDLPGYRAPTHSARPG
jgi:hypothetical protein